MKSITLFILALSASHALAELKLHALFADGMVLQRDKPVRIFGAAQANDKITIAIGALDGSAETDASGRWSVAFDPIPLGTEIPHILVKNRSSGEQHQVNDVLLGDVWVLGGQSNMEFEISKVYEGDIEILSAHFPQIRLLTVPAAAGPDKLTEFEPINQFNNFYSVHEWKGRWDACSPETVRQFSAIGYVFGQRLHRAGQVPIGLIDASRGGTTVETWTSRSSLEQIPGAAKLVSLWDQRAAEFDPEADLVEQLKNWKRHAESQRAKGKKPRPKPTVRPGPALDQNRPANCYNQMLTVLEGLAVRGAIWHQGYNNALGDARPQLFHEIFQTMIRDWRAVFQDEDLPFGIIGFSSGGEPQSMDNFEPQMVDASPYIREAQYRAAQEMENVAYVASWDQQMNWYHPFKKVALGERMARWAMAETFGLQVPWSSARCLSHKVAGQEMVLTFDQKIITHDGRDFEGFAIAGEDRRFYPAAANWVIKGKDNRGRDQYDRTRLKVSHPLVPKPVAVRHAWARNPLGNGVSGEHRLRTLPIPAFRTDTWPFPEAPLVQNNDPAMGEHRKQVRALRQQAEAWATERALRPR